MGSGSSTSRAAPDIRQEQVNIDDFKTSSSSSLAADAEDAAAVSRPTLLTDKNSVSPAFEALIEKAPNAIAQQASAGITDGVPSMEVNATVGSDPRGQGQAVIVEKRQRRLSVAPALESVPGLDAAGVASREDRKQDGQLETLPVQAKETDAREPSGQGQVIIVEHRRRRLSIAPASKEDPSGVASLSNREVDGKVETSAKRTSATRRGLGIPGGIAGVEGASGASDHDHDIQEYPQPDVALDATENAATNRRSSMPDRALHATENAAANRRSSMFSNVPGPRRVSGSSTGIGRSLSEQSFGGVSDDASDSFSDFGAESDGLQELDRDADNEHDLPLEHAKEKERAALKIKYSRRRHSGVDVEGLTPERQSHSPMPIRHAVPIKTFMQLTELKSLEELQKEGMLVELRTGMPITFVALQWSSNTHPDPCGRQLRVLQTALMNLHGGNATLSGDLRRPDVTYTIEDLADMIESYVWIGYCCLPRKKQEVQAGDDIIALRNSTEEFVALADVVDRSKYFLVLAPAMQPVKDEEASLNFASLRENGWLRLAFMVRALSLADTRLLLVEDTERVQTLCSQDHLWTPTVNGTFQSTKESVAAKTVSEELIERKQDAYLAAGRVEDNRLLRCVQSLLHKGTGDHGSGESSDGSSDSEEEQDANNLETLQGASRPQVVSRTVQARAWDFLRIFGLNSAQQPDALNCLAMHYAAICGSPKVLKSLVSIGSEIEVPAEGYPAGEACMGHWPDPKGMTPLHFAALLGQNSMNINCLIELGAQIDARDAKQRTPLMLCCYADNLGVARRLIDLQADLSLKDEVGCTALHQAAAYGRSQMCELLLSKGAPVTKSLVGSSPLFELALCSPTPALVNSLVHAKCAVNEVLATEVDRTVLKKWLALKPVTSHHMLERFVAAHHGMTALMAASMAASGKVAKALVEAGADPGMRNQAGSTSSDVARVMGCS